MKPELRNSPKVQPPSSARVRARGLRWSRLAPGALLTFLALLPQGAAAQQAVDEADPPVYTYRDGDRTLKVVLQEDLVLTRTIVAARDSSQVLASVGDAVIVRLQPEESEGDDPNAASAASRVAAVRPADAQPVFRSVSGTLMALPGGVVVIFDEAWDTARAMSFFAAEGISRDRISPLPLDNSYVVETAPGFPSLDLANRLADRPGVDVSSPNWWREVVLY